MASQPSNSYNTRERERMTLALVAAGSLVAGAGLYWATKQMLDYYVPYRVRGMLQDCCCTRGLAVCVHGVGLVSLSLITFADDASFPPFSFAICTVPLPPWHAQRMAGKRSQQVLEAPPA